MLQIEAMTELKNGITHPVYFVYGSEGFLVKEWLNAARQAIIPPGTETMNLNVFEPGSDQVQQALSTAKTPPFFATQRMVVVRSPQVLAHGGNNEDAELLMQYLDQPVPSTCLVLVHDAPDLRRSICKALREKATVVECRPLDGNGLVRWVQGRVAHYGKQIGAPAADLLITQVGTDLQMLDTELDKLSLYVDGPQIHPQHIQEVVSSTAQMQIFRLTEAVVKKNRAEAVQCLKQVFRQVDHPLQVLGALISQYRLLIAVHSLRQQVSELEEAGRLNIHPYRYKMLSRDASRYSRTELRMAVEHLLAADIAIKTGKDPQIVLETLVIKLMAESADGRETGTERTLSRERKVLYGER